MTENAVPAVGFEPPFTEVIASFVTDAALTVIPALVFAVAAGPATLVAVTVRPLPAVFSVTMKSMEPATSAAFAGNTALASLEVIAMVLVAATRFQFASTALTVTVNGVPAVSADGVPVLPVPVPGAAVSPGTNI